MRYATHCQDIVNNDDAGCVYWSSLKIGTLQMFCFSNYLRVPDFHEVVMSSTLCSTSMLTSFYAEESSGVLKSCQLEFEDIQGNSLRLLLKLKFFQDLHSWKRQL